MLIILAFLTSCKKDKDLPPADLGYNYYPNNVGHWVSYHVDSVAWNAFDGTVDTFHYQIKEIIESIFTDNQGRPTMRIERYIRQSDTNAWVIKNVWYANRTASTAERVEENIRYIKLIFPVNLSAVWNGNAYNSLSEQDYTYTTVYKPYSVGIYTFDSSLTVTQKDQATYIDTDYAIEVYAKHAGLVYKKFIHKVTQPGEPLDGMDYSYTIINWGD